MSKGLTMKWLNRTLRDRYYDTGTWILDSGHSRPSHRDYIGIRAYLTRSAARVKSDGQHHARKRGGGGSGPPPAAHAHDDGVVAGHVRRRLVKG